MDLDALVDGVAAACGLTVQGWRDLGSAPRTNLVLELAGGRTVVARVHPATTPAERVVAEQSLRRACARAGLPVVVPTGLHRLPDGRLVEVEPFAPAADRMRTPARLVAGATLLGRLHDVLRRSAVVGADEPAQANHVHAAEALARTRAGAERMLGWPEPDLHRYATAVVEHVAAVAALEAPLAGGQVVQLVHGDFWDDNVLFDGDEPAVLLDFGFAGRRARVDDLALPFWFWLLEPGHDRPTADDRALLTALADAYDAGTELPLSPVERAALPLAVARQPAWSAGRWVRELPEPEALAHARAAAAELPVAQALLADLPRWQRALTRL